MCGEGATNSDKQTGKLGRKWYFSAQDLAHRRNEVPLIIDMNQSQCPIFNNKLFGDNDVFHYTLWIPINFSPLLAPRHLPSKGDGMLDGEGQRLTVQSIMISSWKFAAADGMPIASLLNVAKGRPTYRKPKQWWQQTREIGRTVPCNEKDARWRTHVRHSTTRQLKFCGFKTVLVPPPATARPNIKNAFCLTNTCCGPTKQGPFCQSICYVTWPIAK